MEAGSAALRVDWPVYPRHAEHNTVAGGGNRRWAETARRPVGLVGLTDDPEDRVRPAQQDRQDLWADRFEEDLADLFKLQDQVVARLANSLGYELIKAEAEKATRSKNPDAIDLAMHGWALIWLEQQPPTKDSYIAARALFDQALKIDPHDADALGGEAMTYLGEYLYGWTNPETDYDAKIVGQTDRAIALDPDNMRAHYVKSLYLLLTHRWNEALSAADAGLAINPNFAPLYATRGVAETSIGRFEQAKSDCNSRCG